MGADRPAPPAEEPLGQWWAVTLNSVDPPRLAAFWSAVFGA